MSLNDLPAHTIELIAGFTDPQHMAMLISTSKTMCSILTASSLAWYAIGKHICGTYYWNNGFERWMVERDDYKPSESAYSFTRSMLCPWLEPPQSIDLYPSSAPPVLMEDREDYTVAWQITIPEKEGKSADDSRSHLQVIAQNSPAGYGFQVGLEDSLDEGVFNTYYRIPARPFDDSFTAAAPCYDEKKVGPPHEYRMHMLKHFEKITHISHAPGEKTNVLARGGRGLARTFLTEVDTPFLGSRPKRHF